MQITQLTQAEQQDTYKKPIQPLTHSTYSPYRKSCIVSFLRKRIDQNLPLKFACLDIDSTMTGEKTVINKTRKRLENLGYALIYNTSRTEELVMKKKNFEKSKKTGYFTRPEPHLGEKQGKKVYVRQETVVPLGLLNPFIIAGSTGTKILVLQEDGSYLPDLEYEKSFHQTAEEWREKTCNALRFLFDTTKITGEFAQIDSKENYYKQKTDVYPPDFRIQLNFKNEEEKNAFVKVFDSFKQNKTIPKPVREQFKNMREIEDSKPEEEKYSVYITPKNGSKSHAIEHILTMICDELSIARCDFYVFFAGDSYPDLSMGLRGGLDVKHSILLLVGGSRLARPLSHDRNFAGRNLKQLHRNKVKISNGHYRVNMPKPVGKRHIINGDELFDGTEAIQTLSHALEYVDQELLSH